MMITEATDPFQLRFNIRIVLCGLIILLTGCKMWPLSVGIYNQGEEKIEIELYVNNKPGAAESFPLMINRFDKDYTDTAFRNISPLKTDTSALLLKTIYQLDPGECLTIASYWDDEYRGYAFYQSPEELKKKHADNDFVQIIIHHGDKTIAGTALQVDRLVKPLNRDKKVWGIVLN